jgi:hypothetical protein
VGDLIAQLAEKAYFLRVDDMIDRVANQEATSHSHNLADVSPTMFVDNTKPPQSPQSFRGRTITKWQWWRWRQQWQLLPL